jgi:hypothetical protein
MATRTVTLTAEDIEETRRCLARRQSIEGVKYLRDKYRDAGLSLRKAVGLVERVAGGPVGVVVSWRKRKSSTGRAPRKKPASKKKARTRRRRPRPDTKG